MGIQNFCKLIDPIAPPSSEPAHFDSLLIDCQSYLYTAIEYSLETRDSELFTEICESTWAQLYNLLDLFKLPSSLTVILSFDGEGVPMKWATQRKRRESQKTTSKKSFYRYILLGHNKLTVAVQGYVWEKLKTYNRNLKIILAGCNVPGEGEHKIFQVAEGTPGCENPIVVSVDQDVFVLAFLRRHLYRTIQIYRYKRFYSISNFVLEIPYPIQRFISLTFLFGNDFVPALITITPNNVSKIHQAATFDEDRDIPATFARFLQNLGPHIRFTPVEFIDRLLIVCFWMTYLWILDYYTRRHFPQQFLENRVYEAFDRNQVLTALSDESYSRSTFHEARETYEDMVTQPIPHAENHIFTDPILLEKLKSYWIKPENSLCNVLQLTSSYCRKRESKERPATDNGILQKRGKIETE